MIRMMALLCLARSRGVFCHVVVASSWAQNSPGLKDSRAWGFSEVGDQGLGNPRVWDPKILGSELRVWI